MSKDADKPSGPERVRKIVHEVFTFALVQRDHFDEKVAEESKHLTQIKLKEICKSCQGAGGEAPQAADSPSIAEKASEPVSHDARRYHLLRLVAAKLSLVFDDPRESARLPRGAVMGIDAYLRRILRMPVYTELNEQAGRILLVSGRDDTTILNSVNANPGHYNFLINVLVRFALSFKDMSLAKEALLDEMRDCTEAGEAEVSEEHFHTMLNALLSDVFLAARSDGDQAMFDYHFGANTARELDSVAKKITRDHQRLMAKKY